MSHISFDASLDTRKLDEAVKLSNKTVKEWSDNIENTGNKIEKTFSQISAESNRYAQQTQKNFQREIGLIADLENALSSLKESRRNATSVDQIEKINQKIQEAEIHLKEYSDAGKVVQDTNESITESMSKWALSLGGATAMLGMLKKAWEDTTIGMNAFNIVGAATKQIMYDITVGGEISIARIGQAIAVQREMNALRLKEYKDQYDAAQLNNEYQQLYIQSVDKTLERMDRIRLIDEALAAHNKAIDIEKQNILENLALAEKNLIRNSGSESYKKEYAQLMTDLENIEAKRVSTTKRLVSMRSGMVKEGIDEEKKWREDLHNNIMKWVEEEQKIDEEQANKLKEVNNNISELKLQGQERELKALDNQYEAEMDKYKYNAEIQMRLTEEYSLKRYEIELKYLKKLQEENKKFAETLDKTDPGRGYSILNRYLIRQGKTPATGTELTNGGPDNFKLASESGERWLKVLAKAFKANKDYNDNIEKSEEDILDLRLRSLQAITDITLQLADQLGVQKEVADSFASSMDMLGSLAQGDYLAAAAGLVQTIINASKIAEMTAEDMAETMSWFNDEVDKLDKKVSKSEYAGGKTQSVEDKLKILKSLQYGFEYDVSFAEYKLRHSIGLNATSRAEALKAAQDNLTAFNEELEATQKLYDELLRGGMTENDIADLIAEGFREGKTSVDDFAQYMNDALLESVMNVFKGELLGPAMNELTKMITDSLSDKVLTSEEKTSIDEKIKTIADANRQLWDDLTGSLNLNGQQQGGLTGAIQRSITEETGTELAGITRNMRDNLKTNTDYMKMGVAHLSMIEANTAATVEQLQIAVTELKAINTNTKSTYSGEL